MNQPVLRVIGEHPEVFRAGVWEDIVVMHWWSQVSPPSAKTFHDLIKALRDESAVPRSYMHLVLDGVGLPDTVTRTSLVRTLKTFEHDIVCMGIVLGGTGFWASAMRNVILGLQVLAPRSQEIRTFANVADLLEWLPDAHAKRTGHAWKATQLQELIVQATAWAQDAAPQQRTAVSP